MKQIKLEDMVSEKNYIAITDGANNEMYATTVFKRVEDGGLSEYVTIFDCSLCGEENGDSWEDADWMFQPDLNLRIFEFPE